MRPITSQFLVVPNVGRYGWAAFASRMEREDDTRTMRIVIGKVLSAEEVETARAALERAHFVDGGITAGFAARMVKRNLQADGSDVALETVRKLLTDRILGNEVFRLAVRPKALSPLIFSRYEKGMHYGSHVDDPVMGGMRTDVSFT